MISKIKQLLIKHKYLVIILLFITCFVSFSLYRTFSVDTTSSSWDGTISSAFSSGSGTQNNPYEINSASDFALLLSTLKGTDASYYKSKYYVVNVSIDFGTYDMGYMADFSGTIDFQGHSLIGGTNTKSIFNTLTNATIKNLRIYNTSLTTSSDTGLIAQSITDSTINNIIIESSITANNKVGSIAYEISNSTLNNILVLNTVSGTTNNYYNIACNLTSVTSSKIYKSNTYSDSASSISVSNISDIDLDTYNGDNKYKVELYDSKYNFASVTEDYTNINKPTNIAAFHASEVTSDTVYVNDLESDYYYYDSLNYTELTSRSSLPGMSSSGSALDITKKYNDSNLVKVAFTYDGTDINNSSLVGYVSYLTNERQSKYIYYKYYYVDNDYITIELIDNPFSYRPKNGTNYLGFNGWVCNTTNSSNDVCSASTISYDDTFYTRSLKIKVSSLTDFDITTDTLNIYMNAFWTNANKRNAASLTDVYNASGNLDSISMKNYTVNVDGENVYVKYYKETYATTYTPNRTIYLYQTSGSATSTTANPIYRRERSGGRYVINQKGNQTYSCSTTNICYVPVTSTTSYSYSNITSGTYYIISSNWGGNTATQITSTNYTNYFSTTQTLVGRDWTTELLGTKYSENRTINMTSLYYKVTGNYNNQSGYYTSAGDACSSSNCGSIAYKLLQTTDAESSYDLSNLPSNTIDVTGYNVTYDDTLYEAYCVNDDGDTIDCEVNATDSNYYYLVTRDTNFIVLTSSISVSNNSTNMGYFQISKPYTLTSQAFQGDSTTIYTFNPTNQNFTLASDMTIENIKFTGMNNTPSSSSKYSTLDVTSYMLNANFHNLKMGRNIVSGTSGYTAFNGIVGTTTNTANKSHKIIIESGTYGAFRAYTGSSDVINYDLDLVLGSDYDRAAKDNLNLNFYYSVYSRKGQGNFCASSGCYSESSSNLKPAVDMLVKSGEYGTAIQGYYFTYDDSYCTSSSCNSYYSDFYNYGIYVLGPGAGSNTSLMRLTVEGGNIFNIASGPGTISSETNITAAIYIKGGNINTIVGGAGVTSTYGNRLVSISGGHITNGVFGGNNAGVKDGASAGNSPMRTLVYIGGNATIGYDSDSEFDTSTSEFSAASKYFLSGNFYGITKGSVFGSGNGNTSKAAGSYDTHLIINGGLIKGDVYGGGNYGYVGYDSTKVTTTVDILAGEIKGSVYGGSNISGFSSATGSANGSKIIINVAGGNTNNIYGGSNTSGTVYGTTTLNILGGHINSIYGGGRGSSTFVEKDTTVNIGENGSEIGPTINTAVYGGSAFGTVGGTSVTTTKSSYKSTVNINSGVVKGAVYGGSQGDTSTIPYVVGSTVVNQYGGDVNSIYGSCNANGVVNGTINVNLYGGNVDSAYGAGNSVGASQTNVLLEGGNANQIFGGANKQGTVTKSLVTLNSGTVRAAYGGNNLGGTTTNSDVEVNGGDNIEYVYGGGNNAPVTNSLVNINSTTSKIENIFGGSNASDATTPIVNMKNGEVGNIYGGSNTLGAVDTSTVTVTGGDVNTVFGGNNLGGTIKTTNVTINGGTIINVYGGGNQVGATKTNISALKGTITNTYGGSYSAGTVDESSIIVNGSSNASSSLNLTYTLSNVRKVTWESTEYKTYADVSVTITNNGTTTINDWEGRIFASDSKIYSNYSGTIVNYDSDAFSFNQKNRWDSNNPHKLYAGSSYTFTFSILTNESLDDLSLTTSITSSSITQSGITIGNLYGGNNLGGETTKASINVTDGKIGNVYGGGNIATTNETKVVIDDGIINKVYGGGNNAGVSTSTVLDINGGLVNYNVYGGGNNGIVKENTTVSITDATISGSTYAGGNGSTATVSGNTTLTIESSQISGDVYGGGNNGPVSGSTNVTLKDTTVSSSTYAGGNGSTATVNGNTTLAIKESQVSDNVYGGGNNGPVSGNTTVTITDATVSGSAYAGGNGSTATVGGNTKITIDGNTVIGTETETNKILSSVFGSGNAASTGTTGNNNTATVNIVGGTIYGNVYGGANTSVVYGNAAVNIGYSTLTDTTGLKKDDIKIYGNVFGGGESNASGSVQYDWSFTSVTNGIDININADDYDNFYIDGSIYGSGDCSSAFGTSNIYIYNYGTLSDIKSNISIQRATNVILDNTYINLEGAKDSENNYSDYLFSLSRIENLTLKNNSYLFLENSGLKVSSFNSLDSAGNKAVVTIDDEGNNTKTVDNRLYMVEGDFLNVALDADATSFGEVNGMTFLGLYKIAPDGTISMGDYDPSVLNGDSSGSSIYTQGTYVQGLHKENHDITVDGYYSNFFDEETNINTVAYIDPTEPTEGVYVWSIGEIVKEYEVDLTATKYSTFGTDELNIMEYSQSNITYNLIGLDVSKLNTGISLVSKNDIKRIADTEEEANSTFALSIEPSNSGWLTTGTTFVYTEGNTFNGPTKYVGENSSTIHSLLFNLYHSKNITLDSGSLGTVTIEVQTVHKISQIENEYGKFIINVNLLTELYQTIEYEGAMTPGDKYDLFTATATNINSTSKFSAYYSLYDGSNLYKTGYYHSLTSSNPLPVNTKMTLIDFANNQTSYYYYVIDNTDYQTSLTEFANENEVSYPLSRFRKMDTLTGSTLYDDATMNAIYFDGNRSTEEFIVIVNFDNTTDDTSILNNRFLIELRNSIDETIFSVLSNELDDLTFNRYSNKNADINITGTSTLDELYNGYSTDLNLDIVYTNQKSGNTTIYDTQYFDSKLGLEITVTDTDGNIISGTALNGARYIIDGTSYYPSLTGTTRFKIADKVGNIGITLKFDTTNANIPSGDYIISITAFGSPDGIYYGDKTGGTLDIPIKIINSTYGLKTTVSNASMVINAKTGTTQDDKKSLSIDFEYTSSLKNPKINMALYRRKYDSVYDTEYELVDLKDYLNQALFGTSRELEYLVVDDPSDKFTLNLLLKSNLKTGTYRLDFMLCENDVVIGKVSNYIIIK